MCALALWDMCEPTLDAATVSYVFKYQSYLRKTRIVEMRRRKKQMERDVRRAKIMDKRKKKMVLEMEKEKEKEKTLLLDKSEGGVSGSSISISSNLNLSSFGSVGSQLHDDVLILQDVDRRTDGASSDHEDDTLLTGECSGSDSEVNSMEGVDQDVNDDWMDNGLARTDDHSSTNDRKASLAGQSRRQSKSTAAPRLTVRSQFTMSEALRREIDRVSLIKTWMQREPDDDDSDDESDDESDGESDDESNGAAEGEEDGNSNEGSLRKCPDIQAGAPKPGDGNPSATSDATESAELDIDEMVNLERLLMAVITQKHSVFFRDDSDDEDNEEKENALEVERERVREIERERVRTQEREREREREISSLMAYKEVLSLLKVNPLDPTAPRATNVEADTRVDANSDDGSGSLARARGDQSSSSEVKKVKKSEPLINRSTKKSVRDVNTVKRRLTAAGTSVDAAKGVSVVKGALAGVGVVPGSSPNPNEAPSNSAAFSSVVASVVAKQNSAKGLPASSGTASATPSMASRAVGGRASRVSRVDTRLLQRLKKQKSIISNHNPKEKELKDREASDGDSDAFEDECRDTVTENNSATLVPQSFMELPNTSRSACSHDESKRAQSMEASVQATDEHTMKNTDTFFQETSRVNGQDAEIISKKRHNDRSVSFGGDVPVPALTPPQPSFSDESALSKLALASEVVGVTEGSIAFASPDGKSVRVGQSVSTSARAPLTDLEVKLLTLQRLQRQLKEACRPGFLPAHKPLKTLRAHALDSSSSSNTHYSIDQSPHQGFASYNARIRYFHTQ